MVRITTGRVASLAATVSMAAVLALGPRAASAQGLNLTDAEKTAAKCDANYKVADLAGFKAPKAKKPYHLEFSVPMFIPYIQALIYGAQLAAKDAGVTLTVKTPAKASWIPRPRSRSSKTHSLTNPTAC